MSRFQVAKITSYIPVILSLFATFACTKEKKSDLQKTEKKTIKIGTIAGPETELMEVIRQVAWDEYKLKVEIITFNDFMTPNIALDDKSLDANAYQHMPYLNDAIKSRGFKFSSIGQTFIYPVAAYSKKIKNMNDLPNDAKIAIPNDPTNEGRSLLLLEKQGLIKLKSGSGLNATPVDIVENPKNLKFIELEAAQLPRVLEDTEIAIINTVFAASANLKPKRDGLFLEGSDSPYTNIVVVRTEDKNAEWAIKLIKSFQHQKVVAAADRIFSGNAVPAWN